MSIEANNALPIMGSQTSAQVAKPAFTAARLACALGRDKRGILRQLRYATPVGQILVNGKQLANAWTIDSLPQNYRNDLDRICRTKGYRTPAHLLSDGFSRWRPEIPLPEIARHHVEKSVRLKKALSRAISLHLNPLAGISQIRAAAWEDYQKEFGSVSERTSRRALDRAIARDAGEENFDDLALYLCDKLSRERDCFSVLPGLLSPYEQAVQKYLSAVRSPSSPTIHETDLIWFAVCESIQHQVDSGAKSKTVRRSMISFLSSSAVRLSANEHALKKLLKLKLARYVASSGEFNEMSDKRAEKSGWKRANQLDREDRNLIVAHAALNKGGRLAPALRELREDGKLSLELESHHISNPASKSYVPKSLRDQVQGDIRRLKNMEHGPRTHKLNGPYLTRDYSSMSAGDWFQADDVTLPVYYYEETESGPIRMRGQFLVMIDVRTDFVLGFLLISERNYDSLSIRSLITACAAKHGLPRRGFYFERGIWKNSRIIAGNANALPFEHADRGLRALGMKLCHANLPRGKVIERTIGQLQSRLEGFPGYAGRDERHDIRERAQRLFLEVDAGRKPINESLLSKSQYCDELALIIEDHNSEPQSRDSRLKGLSPREAWEALQGNVPRQGFDSKWRYVLARDVRKVKVGRNGITLRYGKKPFVYHDTETGKRVGDEVLAWFDPMLPDVLACTDLDRKNVFSVERANNVPAVDAPPELLGEEMAKIDAHQSYAKALYWTSRNTLKSHHYAMTVADEDTLRIGSDIAAQRKQITAKNEERVIRERANRSLIERQQLPPELLASADRMSTDTIKAIGNLLNDSEQENNQ